MTFRKSRCFYFIDNHIECFYVQFVVNAFHFFLFSFFSVNVVILLLIAVAFLIIVHRNLISLNDFLRGVSSDSHHMGLQPFDFLLEAPQRSEVARTGEEVPVVITAAGERLGALIAAMNSIYSNTKSNVVFHIVTMNDTADHLKNWLSKTGLKDIKYRIVQFDPQVLEGKIRRNPVESEPLKPYNYIGFLDYKKDSIRKLGMKATTCSFNPGVFVANLTEWKRQNITKQLEKWMELNVAEDLYSRTLAGSITTPPLLIVFYKKHSSIDPMWHVRHLGQFFPPDQDDYSGIWYCL
ncbi:UNVERIFIED_CONTAM: hypothetical protein FKN15_019072 [Acipenser sinensis]